MLCYITNVMLTYMEKGDKKKPYSMNSFLTEGIKPIRDLRWRFALR